MHLISAIILLGSACSVIAELSAGQRSTLMAMRSIFERQTQLCQPVTAPVTCERSCGPTFRQCVSYPNCYNPAAGESCCSNGEYCSAGYYCTDAGCCPDGTSLADCGASESFSVIPPAAATTSVPSAPSTSTAAPTTSSPSPTSTSSASPTSSSSVSPATSPSTQPFPTFTPSPTTSSSLTSTTSTPSTSLIQAGAAGQTFSFDLIHAALGWVGVLFLVL